MPAPEILTFKKVFDVSKELVEKNPVFAKKIFSEIRFFFKDVNCYFELLYEQNYRIKTILNRDEPRNISEVYQPLSANIKGESLIINYENLFGDRDFIILKGTAGSGKSTAMKHLLVDCITNYRTIPIHINLRDVTFINDKSLLQEIVNKFIDHKISADQNIIKRMIKNGKFLFIMDGYDEISKDSQNHFIKAINNFVMYFNNNKIVITTRPTTNLDMLDLFSIGYIETLSKKERIQFIRRFCSTTTAEAIINSINYNDQGYISDLLGTPLLLSLYILTYSHFQEIPQDKSTFYSRVINALIIEHDSLTKEGYSRPLYSNIDYNDMIGIIRYFSFKSLYFGEIEFSKDYAIELLEAYRSKVTTKFETDNVLKDMLISYCLLIDDDGLIRFIHKSIQEYLAVEFIKNSPQKEKILKQIVQQVCNDESVFILEKNFCDILQETDEYYYFKFMYIPFIEYLIAKLEHKSKKQIVTNLYSAAFFNVEENNFAIKSTALLYSPIIGIMELLDNSEMSIIFRLFDLDKAKPEYFVKNNSKKELSFTHRLNLEHRGIGNLLNTQKLEEFINFLYITKKNCENELCRMESLIDIDELIF